jgi:hypothetical protein
MLKSIRNPAEAFYLCTFYRRILASIPSSVGGKNTGKSASMPRLLSCETISARVRISTQTSTCMSYGTEDTSSAVCCRDMLVCSIKKPMLRLAVTKVLGSMVTADSPSTNIAAVAESCNLFVNVICEHFHQILPDCQLSVTVTM